MAITASRLDGRPTCPQGHPGRVIAFGRQVRADDAYSRPRFRCFPSDGSAKHTFTPPRRQPTHGHPHGAVCVHCERDYGPADGARTGRRYSQSVMEIGSLLASVAHGDSLRVASRDARNAARRLSLGPFSGGGSPRVRQAYNSRQNVLAARYLDAYGPDAVSELLPRRWPRLLVLDSKPLGIRPYGVVEWDDWDDTMPGGSLLMATGTDLEQRQTTPWRVGIGADETHRSWLEFFDQLEGKPEWIVADRASAIWKAVEMRWPSAQHFACAWHLTKNLTDAAYRDGVFHEGTDFTSVIRAAFHSTAEWDALADLAEKHRAENILLWMIENEHLIAEQIELRARFPDRPRSNGAAERLVAEVDERLGKRRRNFRNARRLSTVIGLMAAEMRGDADPLTLDRVVRDAIESGNAPRLLGDPGMDRGAVVNDPTATSAGSIASLLLSGGLQRQAANRAYWVSAKTTSVQRRADALNGERARRRLPLIEVKLSKGRVAAVSVRGKMLTDFFEFADEWATDRNGHGPDGIKAGHYSEKVWWRCQAGHQWQATVSDRITRLLRCRRCSTKRADETNSLAAVYPELLASWDDDRNHPLGPHAIRATYPRRVVWKCLIGLNDPTYQASIAKRRKDDPPCPLCRKMRPARGRVEAARRMSKPS